MWEWDDALYGLGEHSEEKLWTDSPAAAEHPGEAREGAQPRCAAGTETGRHRPTLEEHLRLPPRHNV